MLPEITADWLLARVRDDGEGHLIWTRYSQRGDPKATFGVEAIPFNVRRVIWKAMTGKAPPKGTFIRARCGVLNCVEPSCLMQLPNKARLAGRKQTMVARARNAATQRKKSHLTDEALADIRAAECTQVKLAQKWGVSQAMVSRIQLGKNWQPITTPFAGLGAR